MSAPEKCPHCGSPIANPRFKTCFQSFECGLLRTCIWPTQPVTAECLRRQIANRDERIATLEAKLAESVPRGAAQHAVWKAISDKTGIGVKSNVADGYITLGEQMHEAKLELHRHFEIEKKDVSE